MKQSKYAILIVLASILLLGVGYASITNITLELDGDASLAGQTGIVISDISVNNVVGADSNSQVINTYYQTMINTRTVLGDDANSTVTYEITIENNSNNEKIFEGVVFDSSFYSNNEIGYTLNGLNVGDTIDIGDQITFQLTFHYNDVTHTNNILDSVLNFNFEDYQNFVINSSCVFHGQGRDVTGDCVGPDDHVDYINKGFSLFSQENNHRDFIIEFELGEIANSRFRGGKVDTIFSNLNEDNNIWPGIVFRIENSKWYFQAGYGPTRLKVTFNRGSFTRFKVFRDNGKIYYQLDNNHPIMAADMTSFTNYFESPLTLGVALYPDGSVRTERYLIGELAYLNFAFAEQNINDIIDAEIEDFLNTDLTTVYSSTNAQTFDGTSSTGVHTNVSLLDSTNYQKDFVATFDIDSFNIASQTNNQATLFNIKDETGNGNPGIYLRKNGSNLELNVEDGYGGNSTATIAATAKRINIIKKGMDIYYQVDTDSITSLGSMANFDANKCFLGEATFGSIIDENGTFAKVIVGTLSNMRIKVSH